MVVNLKRNNFTAKKLTKRTIRKIILLIIYITAKTFLVWKSYYCICSTDIRMSKFYIISNS